MCTHTQTGMQKIDMTGGRGWRDEPPSAEEGVGLETRVRKRWGCAAGLEAAQPGPFALH